MTAATAPAVLSGVPDAADALHVRALSHWYEQERGERLHALTAIDCTVRSGEFVSLIGPSGCGKTTLLRAAAGLLRPSEGQLRVLGGAPGERAVARQTGLVMQDPGLLPWRTVAANVALALDIAGVRHNSSDITALLERVGIAPFAGYYPRELSGGMRQRVALARALAGRPRLLLMDEPFGALDELSREQLRAELLRLWEQERTSVLFVTHAIREAVLLSDRVVVMSARPGRVVADLEVRLPRPRSSVLEDDARFTAEVARVRAALAEGPR